MIPHEDEFSGLLLAFEKYATGDYSDLSIAQLLNEKGYKTKKGRPFSKDTVRDMLQNKTYLGKVKYQPYARNSDGSRSYSGDIEWFDGQHKPLIDEDLFNRCQEIRGQRVSHRKPTSKFRAYLLRSLIYCYDCCSTPPDSNPFLSYGKMRPQPHKTKGGYSKFYRCRAKEMGYSCTQKKVKVEIIDEQVMNILTQLRPPKNWKENIAKSIGDLLGEQKLDTRLAEIREKIERMDKRWDYGFITDEDEYIRQRVQLQHELEQLTPIDNEDLERAVELLDNFPLFLENCQGDTNAQSELIKRIVERVYVKGDDVVAMTLHSNCHLVLGHKTNEPTEYTVDPFMSNLDGPVRERRDLNPRPSA